MDINLSFFFKLKLTNQSDSHAYLTLTHTWFGPEVTAHYYLRNSMSSSSSTDYCHLLITGVPSAPNQATAAPPYLLVLQLGRPQIDALAGVALLLVGDLLDVAAVAEAAHGAGEPLLQRVARALGPRRAGLDGAERRLRLERGHRLGLPSRLRHGVVLWKQSRRSLMEYSTHGSNRHSNYFY